MDNGKYSYIEYFDNKPHKDLFLCLIIAVCSYIFLHKNFLIFHTMAQSATVIIAFVMTSISLSTYRANTNRSIVFLGIAYAFVGSFDFFHIFTYKGMGSLADATGNTSTQLWVVARYIESISFFIALVLWKKRIKINIRGAFFCYLIITMGLLTSIFCFKAFPDCIGEGGNFTSFKIISECIIIGILIASIIYFIRNHMNNKTKANIFIITSLATTAISEMFFLLDAKPQKIHAYGLIFKLISYYFLYMALARTRLQEPYIALSGLNNALVKQNAKLEKLVYELEIESEYRRKIERENIRKKQILNSVLESTIDGILVLDNDKNLVHVNTRFFKLMNIPHKVVLNGDINEIIEHIKSDSMDPEDLDKYCKEVFNCKNTYTFYLRHKNQRVYEITGLPYIDNGQKEGTVISIRDITDREMVEELKRSIEMRKELLREAKKIDEMKTSFFTNISHEIRTPLNIILGVIQLLDSEDNEIKGYYQLSEEDIYALKKNCYRLIKLSDNLMDITKIDSGYMHLNLLNHDIVSIVRDTTYSVADYIKNSNISITFKTDIKEKIMACDAKKIERVLLNLLSNAVKFIESDGHILVSVENKEEFITIKVRDNGIGIPNHMIDKVFDRLKQVDTSLRRMNEGTGIGLSLVKSIVEMHGGHISVRSKVGQGSEFTIELPVQFVEEDEEVYADTYMGIDRVHIEFSDIYGIN